MTTPCTSPTCPCTPKREPLDRLTTEMLAALRRGEMERARELDAAIGRVGRGD